MARLLLVAMILPRLVVTTLALGSSLPEALAHPAVGEAARQTSARFVDREGLFLQERRAGDGSRFHPMPLDQIGLRVRQAVIAAEDQRFYEHSGVDWTATARAFVTSVARGRWVSGASTITQQLVRAAIHAPRTAAAKLEVMALAVRIEASLGKDEILERYLNGVDFGPRVVGVEAASEYYFDKSSASLSLAEAAALAGLPRGPTFYDPRRGTARLRARRDVILDRMRAAGVASEEEVRSAKLEPLVLAPRTMPRPAPHFVRAIDDGAFGALPVDAVEIQTTLDATLQEVAETAARRTARALEAHGGTAASVVVLDNASGEVLAYVGAPDVSDAKHLGENDGVRAARQPGSSLKPFVYELGMERRGWSPSTLFADVETSFPSADGSVFRPHNYDQRFHGPVLLRDALGNSLNVPAVVAAEEIGVPDLLARLRALGFDSLERPASHYGLALALGDGEVTLIELANAYATLARGGVGRPVVGVRSIVRADGAVEATPKTEGTRLLDERATFMVTDILADRTARLSSFGEDSVLELPFAVAAKTGTSKGYRDNIAVGYTSRVTVAVWVGNFDGSPMKGISGVTGAGPLFHDVMRAAAARYPSDGFVEPPGIEHVEVCSLSGDSPTHACPHHRADLTFAGAARRSCAVHVDVVVDTSNGLTAGPECALADVEERVFERWPASLLLWARATGRGEPPSGSSPRCPTDVRADVADLRITYPEAGARFHVDPGAATPSAIRVRARAPHGVEVLLLVDGVPRPFSEEGVELTLVPGKHVLVLRDPGHGVDGETVEVTVD